MWKTKRPLLLCTIALFAATTSAAAQEAELLAVLRSDATFKEKSDACRKLARIATKQSVPTLAGMLGDEKLSHMARYALEPIQDDSVDAALRDALGKVEGGARLGVIGSLGVRRDTKAVEALAALLKEKDTAQAAARALGNIGNLEASQSLEAALAGTSGDVQLALCEGLFRCAESLAAANQSKASVEIYDRLRGLKDAPPQVRAAALRGAIVAKGAGGVPILVEALRGSDDALANAATRAALDSTDTAIVEALTAELPSLPARRKTLLVMALTARGESRVLPTVLQVAKGGDTELRLLALRAMKRIGNASCVPVLLSAAEDENGAISTAATEALESLQDDAVDQQVAEQLAKAEGKRRILLMDLAKRRRTTAASPAIWKAASDKDPQVRVAALQALGAILDTADLPKLIARLPETPAASEAAALDQALRDVCLRSEDREAVAKQLADAVPKVDQPVKARVFDTLSVLGGETALAAVAAAARAEDRELQDSAWRVLGKWKSADVAPVLVDLHKTADDSRIKIRAVRGYIRIARQFSMPADQRAAMCRKALEMADRNEDKRLVLEVLLRYPSEEMQAIAMEAAGDPALKDQAMLVVMGMASKGVNRAELGKALAEAGHSSVKLEILKATYGAGKKSKDVTDTLRKYAKSYRIIFLPDTSYNKSFGGDPAQGTAKQLVIKYRLDGKEAEVTLQENATILLPTPK